jgi:hypothetical protein
MKPGVYQALKEFEERLLAAFPEATFELIDPFGGNDVAVEIFLHVEAYTYEERVKLSEIGADIEEKYDVYIGTLTHAQAA